MRWKLFYPRFSRIRVGARHAHADLRLVLPIEMIFCFLLTGRTELESDDFNAAELSLRRRVQGPKLIIRRRSRVITDEITSSKPRDGRDSPTL